MTGIAWGRSEHGGAARSTIAAGKEVAGHGMDVAVREDGRDASHGTGPAEGDLQQPERRGDLARRELARATGSRRGPGDAAGRGPARIRPDEPAPRGLELSPGRPATRTLS